MASFNTFKTILYTSIAVVVLGALLLYFFYNPSTSEIFPKCPFYMVTNLYCPGCGSQRAVHQFLNGHILEGLRHNWLLLLVFVVLGYQTLILLLKQFGIEVKKNILHRPVTTYAILILFILFWFLRNINVFPLTELAP